MSESGSRRILLLQYPVEKSHGLIDFYKTSRYCVCGHIRFHVFEQSAAGIVVPWRGKRMASSQTTVACCYGKTIGIQETLARAPFCPSLPFHVVVQMNDVGFLSNVIQSDHSVKVVGVLVTFLGNSFVGKILEVVPLDHFYRSFYFLPIPPVDASKKIRSVGTPSSIVKMIEKFA